jgi:aconitate hydratase
MTATPSNLGAKATLNLAEGTAVIYRLDALARQGMADLERLPFSIRVLLENALRHAGHGLVSDGHVTALAKWSPKTAGSGKSVHACPGGAQDFTGCPASWTSPQCGTRWRAWGARAERINPVVPSDLVIDHSVQVDHYGSAEAFRPQREPRI